ncbi:unnamed protein product [Prunus brigantina]
MLFNRLLSFVVGIFSRPIAMKMEESQGKECKSRTAICFLLKNTSIALLFIKKRVPALPCTLLHASNTVRKWVVPSDLFGTLPGRQIELIYNNRFQPEKHIDETLKLLRSL